MLILFPTVVALTVALTTHKAYIWQLAANQVALVCFALDKHKAKKNKWRLREADLLLVCFFFPFGSLLGIAFCRHKTSKLRFWLTAAIAAPVHAGIMFWWHWEKGEKIEAIATVAAMGACFIITAGREVLIRMK